MATYLEQPLFLGTGLKLNIHIEPMGEMTMDDYNFEVEIYCSSKRAITVKKQDAIRNDENNYIVLVDTNIVGSGTLKCKVTAYIPDGDFEDHLRTEIVIIDTGINIVKSL